MTSPLVMFRGGDWMLTECYGCTGSWSFPIDDYTATALSVALLVVIAYVAIVQGGGQ